MNLIDTDIYQSLESITTKGVATHHISAFSVMESEIYSQFYVKLEHFANNINKTKLN